MAGFVPTAASTRPPHARAPTPAAAISGAPARIATAAPAPARTMPPGDIIASATFGVKNRSRNERSGHRCVRRHQKLEITAVKTCSMVCGLLALYVAALVAWLIARSVITSADSP